MINEYNSWITGLLGCELMILGYILHRVLTSQMPSNMCKALDENLRDTQCFLESVAERGLLPEAQYIADIRQVLVR